MIEKLDTKCHYPLKKGDYYIYDDDINNKPLFCKVDEKWNLNIINKSNINVDFFQNDECLMTNKNLKKCDWIIIFKDEFYFIEAKDVKIKQRSKAKKNAEKKFEVTIPYFLNLYPEIEEMKIKVILNLRSTSNLTSSADKNRRNRYNVNYNTKYIETNSLTFN